MIWVTHARAGSAATPHDDLDRFVRTRLAEATAVSAGPPADVPADWLQLFDAMAGSRLLDIAARRLRERGLGFYTIGSAGHEANALVAVALLPTDPALLHYRSGAVLPGPRASRPAARFMTRFGHVLLGPGGGRGRPADPGGRHKVFGDAVALTSSRRRRRSPRTCRGRSVWPSPSAARARLGVDIRWPADAVAHLLVRGRHASTTRPRSGRSTPACVTA